MYTVNSLSAMPYAQAKVIRFDNGGIVLRSYVTEVANIDAEGWLVINGLYSATTRKHIGAFMRECVPGGTYQLAKQLYTDGMMYNIYTGEVKEI